MTTENDIPKAIWEGTFSIFGVEVRCAVLEDGVRVVNGDDFMKVLSGDTEANTGDLEAFMNWQAGTGIPDEPTKP